MEKAVHKGQELERECTQLSYSFPIIPFFLSSFLSSLFRDLEFRQARVGRTKGAKERNKRRDESEIAFIIVPALGLTVHSSSFPHLFVTPKELQELIMKTGMIDVEALILTKQS